VSVQAPPDVALPHVAALHGCRERPPHASQGCDGICRAAGRGQSACGNSLRSGAVASPPAARCCCARQASPRFGCCSACLWWVGSYFLLPLTAVRLSRAPSTPQKYDHRHSDMIVGEYISSASRYSWHGSWPGSKSEFRCFCFCLAGFLRVSCRFARLCCTPAETFSGDKVAAKTPIYLFRAGCCIGSTTSGWGCMRAGLSKIASHNPSILYSASASSQPSVDGC
jgi:hypothetical protein